MIQTVFFDLDGTLLDTAPDLATAINKTLKAHGKEALEFSRFRYSIYGGSKTMLCQGFGFDDQHPDYASINEEFLQNYHSNIAAETRLFPGMEEVLAYLERKSIAWGVITNKPTWLTEPLMAALKLTDRAICVISGDTLEKRKPHPMQLHHACKITRANPSHTVYIGDTEVDIQAARAAGMYSIAVRYGYAPFGSTPEKWRADQLVDQALEIIPWLERRTT